MRKWAEVAAAAGTHEAVLAWALSLPFRENRQGDKDRGSLLDLPSGAGALSAKLSASGFRVTASDIVLHEGFKGDKSKFVRCDANQPLPFVDESFDVVCSIEGIEHLENPSAFLREIHRVLKPGGHAAISTPNVDSYTSKRNNFFKGYPRYFAPKSPFEKDSGHLLPIDLIFMKGALRRSGLTLQEVRTNLGRPKKTLRSELFRALVAKSWPAGLGEDPPFYGEVLIYCTKKPNSFPPKGPL